MGASADTVERREDIVDSGDRNPTVLDSEPIMQVMEEKSAAESGGNHHVQGASRMHAKTACS